MGRLQAFSQYSHLYSINWSNTHYCQYMADKNTNINAINWNKKTW